MAIERGEFFVGYCQPLRSQLTEPLHPALATLTFQTGRLPDDKQAVTWKKAFDLLHEGLFLRCAEMVERLANPDHVERTCPIINCLGKILTSEFDWTRK